MRISRGMMKCGVELLRGEGVKCGGVLGCAVQDVAVPETGASVADDGEDRHEVAPVTTCRGGSPETQCLSRMHQLRRREKTGMELCLYNMPMKFSRNHTRAHATRMRFSVALAMRSALKRFLTPADIAGAYSVRGGDVPMMSKKDTA